MGKNAAENNAYIADRPLEGPLKYLYSRNPIDDYFNTEILHEQLFFEDEKGGNIGFFGDGTVREDSIENLPKYKVKDNISYNDDLAREAIKNIKTKPYHLLWFQLKEDKYNCQDYMQDFRDEYNRLFKSNNGI